jgi:hypothetical protein
MSEGDLMNSNGDDLVVVVMMVCVIEVMKRN